MKNVTLFGACLIACSMNLNAQTITSAWSPAPGTTNILFFDESIDNQAAPSEGSGQMWDFSSLDNDSTFIEIFSNVANAAGASNFPSATVVNVIAEDGVEISNYFQASSSAYSISGTYISGSGITGTYIYTDSADVYRFPIGLGQSYTDTYAATINSIFTFSQAGTVQVGAVGTGTLMIPTGTFSNVILVKTIDTYSFSGLPPIPGSSTGGVNTSYTFLSADYNGKTLLTYRIEDDLVNPADTIISYSDPMYVGIEPVASNVIGVYPNPVNNQLVVKGNADISRVEIIDLQGRLVQSTAVTVGNSVITLNTSDLTNGLYLVKAITSSGAISTTRVVVAH